MFIHTLITTIVWMEKSVTDLVDYGLDLLKYSWLASKFGWFAAQTFFLSNKSLNWWDAHYTVQFSMHLRVVSLVGSLNIEYFLSILKASITSDLPFIHCVCVCACCCRCCYLPLLLAAASVRVRAALLLVLPHPRAASYCRLLLAAGRRHCGGRRCIEEKERRGRESRWRDRWSLYSITPNPWHKHYRRVSWHASRNLTYNTCQWEQWQQSYHPQTTFVYQLLFKLFNMPDTWVRFGHCPNRQTHFGDDFSLYVITCYNVCTCAFLYRKVSIAQFIMKHMTMLTSLPLQGIGREQHSCMHVLQLSDSR